MSGIKLEYNKEYIVINKINHLYQIDNVKQWIFLTKFKKAFLIIKHPYGSVETIVDRKFVYNQDFELVCDLDFNFRYIYPLGNFPENNDFYHVEVVPFTGTFNGNNFKFKNINIINCNYNGLFGIAKSGSISNLIIQNVVINDGIYNGALVGKAYSVDLTNIKIIGNIILGGRHSACLVGLFEGNCKNLEIIVDGEIISDSKSLITNYFYGNIENVSVISNINSSVNCIDVINGRVKNLNLISFKSTTTPFYNFSKYHQISNCCYFQMNNEPVIINQEGYNIYWRNLDESNHSQIKNANQMIQIENNYYLNEVINYSNENIPVNNSNYQIKIYDLKSGESNIDSVFIDINGIFKGDEELEPFDKNKIMSKCKKMESIYQREIECNNVINELTNKNLFTRLKSIKSHMDDNKTLDYNDKLVSENNSHCFEEYESDSQYVSSDEEDTIFEFVEEHENNKTAEITILKNLDTSEDVKKAAIDRIQKELEEMENERKLLDNQ